ncbi:PQQ-dependent sugar dehydrogenase [Aquimarina sp. U1-2]|uniref:PQQ-dependent sugar dehydrogenase n=1 Tax=Aquimarina sp. U1-2 TaxID=2823141 RepID=UPI001AECCE19|nr:PQQ-dependent sugar dehydrogenase [Aquimarina sp. U1-2]MBP2831956.1 PQQ-dependent sugar dehydrogenase [Aquimarina sp. U1-2]
MKRKSKILGFTLLSLILCSQCNNDDTPNPNPNPGDGPIEATSTLINTLSIPWELTWGPDNFLWVTERNGKISRINPDTGEQIDVLQINEVAQVQESGLLGMVHHPDFELNPYIYVVYTYGEPNELKEKLVRYSYGNGTLSNEITLLDNIPAGRTHNGSRLLITPDLKIIMSTGDAGDINLSQNINSLAGKVLRLNLDGSIPNDNPISNSYIYSYGHRNAQGLTWHPNGNLYSSEHGPNTDDEINRIEMGKNYGWPEVKGIIDTDEEQAFALNTKVEESIFNWTPTIAPSDLIFYTYDNIPQWKNKLLMTVLKEQQIIALTLNDEGTNVVKEEKFFTKTFGRLRDIAVSPTGRIFIATNGDSYTDNTNTHSIIEIRSIE